MGQQLFYSSTAVQTTLAASLTSSGTSVELTSNSGYPTQFPFTLLLEWGTANQEVVTVTQAATGTGPFTYANCVRGVDGTTGVSHSSGAQVNHGVSAEDFFQIAPVFNVCGYGADPTGTNNSHTAIQAAIDACATAGGGVVYFPAGSYTISSALTAGGTITIAGDGCQVTTINQSSTSANIFTFSGAGEIDNITVRDLSLTGPGSGTGVGLSLASGGTDNPIEQLTLRNLIVSSMGSHGIDAVTPISSVIDNVVSQDNGGRGFYVTGVPADGVHATSVTFTSCYANDNALDGYYLQSLAYSVLNACASDTNATGYVIAGCQGVTLNSCGAEGTVAKNSLDGTSFKITEDSASVSSNGIVLNGCKSLTNNAVAFWVTGGSKNITLNNAMEIAPGGSASASIKTDSSTMTTLNGWSVSTATSLTSLTYNELNDGSTGEFTLAGTAFFNLLEVFGTAQFKGQDSSDAAAKFFSGTLETTAEAGAVEYDGTAFYATSAASSRQVVSAEQIQILSGTRTFTNNTSAQAIFNATTNGALTVQGSTTYEFECLLNVSGFSSSTHTVSFGLTGLTGTAATFTSVMYNAIMATTAGGNSSIINEQSASASQISNSGTGTILNGIIRGTMRINAGGTITPALTQVTASAAAVVQANSYFRCWPIGSNTVTHVGDWS